MKSNMRGWCVMFNRILYGGDYNPNQWPKETWTDDMLAFKKAGINSATINVFSWSKLQPSENEYDFTELDDIINMLTKEKYDIVLATATAAMPGWLYKRYPEIGRVDYEGRHHRFGERHNFCPNSLVYQKYASRLVEEIAKRYSDNKQVTCWHINNEYGGTCYCDKCEKAFRVWVKDKYRTIEAVNKAWNTEFWGHTLYDFDDIVVPNLLGDGLGDGRTAFAGLSLDYKRFNSDSLLNCFKMERDIIRKYDQDTPVTTNLMGTYKELDYFKWAKEMDIVSWDNYPSYNTPWSYVAFCHDLMRGLKQQPFMLMEQTPSQQNWQPYNSLKRPGQMRAQSYQTIAHGGDTIQFFQLKRSVGACEKFHGAVLEHANTTETRVFREVSQLGHELEKLDGLIGSQNKSRVALIFDWDNYWALEFTSGPSIDLRYVDQMHHYYRYFCDRNISVDIISTEADLSLYDIVLAPVLYLFKDGMTESLESYVAKGGKLVTTYMSGIVDQSDNVILGGYPGPLKELAGIWVEEIDALAPSQFNLIKEKSHGTIGKGTIVADIIHLETAQSLADYQTDFYAGSPAVTKNDYEEGSVYYIGSQLDDDLLSRIFDCLVAETSITKDKSTANGLEITTRETDKKRYTLVMNFAGEPVGLPERFVGKKDQLTDKAITTPKIEHFGTYLFVEENKSLGS